MSAPEDALAAAVQAHVCADAWPGCNVLAFMASRIEDAPRRLTIACQVATGAPLLCQGRVTLGLEDLDGTPILWPAGGCSNGHPLADVERAYAYQADAMARGAPGPADDPLGVFVLELGRQAAAVGLDRRALQLAIRKAGYEA